MRDYDSGGALVKGSEALILAGLLAYCTDPATVL